MSDPIGALVQVLLSDTAVAAIVGTRVFGSELPNEIAAAMPVAALVVAPSGGASLTGASNADADTQRIDLIAYAATPRDADQLRAVAAQRLFRIERETIAGTLIHWVNRAGGFSQARDRDGHWPQSFQSFQIFHALKEVP